MAKRIRGSRSSHRPGGHGPSHVSDRTTNLKADAATLPAATSPAAASPAATPVAHAPIRQTLPHGGRAPAEEAPSGSTVSRSTRGRVKVKPNSLLAARAATEYVYVGQDLRRIAVVGSGLFAALALLWVVLVPLDVAGIY